jgi:hypothetical protein
VPVSAATRQKLAALAERLGLVAQRSA